MIYSFSSLLGALGTSKQGFHQRLGRLRNQVEQHAYLFQIIGQIRSDHPTMSCRAMYYKILPDGMGRDAFERLCGEWGMKTQRSINYQRTTDSTGVTRFENLTVNFTATKINQLWSSDITYFEVGDRFYYLTFIMDNYSRRILGHSVSGRLLTEQTTLPALHQAIKTRGTKELAGLIFHSDGGGQYYDKLFLALTLKYGIRNSMCEKAWENGMAERLNGIIKNNYLRHWKINSYEDLVKHVDRAVLLYNNERPHKALNFVSPFSYENQQLHLPVHKSKKAGETRQSRKLPGRG